MPVVLPMPVLVLLLQAIVAPPEGVLAFSAGPTPAAQAIHILDAGTGDLQRVGQGNYDGVPRWSPDGARLAYASGSPDARSIHLASPDGSSALKLTHARPWNNAPAWDPEARRLAYESGDGPGFKTQLAIYDLETGQETLWADGREGLVHPVWLPSTDLFRRLNPAEGVTWKGIDTDLLIEEVFEHGVVLALGVTGEPGALSTEILICTPSLAAPLLGPLGADSHRYTEWNVAPNNDGRKIAFESNDGGDREIFVLGKRGVADISNHRKADWNPKWDASGEWLAFESFRNERRSVYRLFPDTGRVYPLAVSDRHGNWAPAWSPDGNWIVHLSDRGGRVDLYATEVDGGEILRLTDTAAVESPAVWRPEP